MADVDAAARDAATRERLDLRRGGTVAVRDDDILVEVGDELTRVALEEITEVTYQEFDWFLGVLSVALVAWGGFSTRQSLPIGLAFAAFGVGSLYLTYRKRGKVTIRVLDRPKPLTVFPADPSRFMAAMEAAIGEE